MTDDATSTASLWPLIVLWAACYFLPALIGWKRNVSNRVVLLTVNLLTAWTGIMWIVCLLWSVMGATKAQDDFYRARGDR